jgi:hypothetical protein
LAEAAYRSFPRGIVPGALQASWRKLRSVSLRLNLAEVLFEQPLGSEGLSFGFAIGSAGFHQRPRNLPPSNRQACERHQSTKQAGKDPQRYDAQGPDNHKPSDAAELQLQCRQRRH